MRDFTKVSNSIWNSAKFNSLNDDQTKLAYLYILTCPHSNSSGCFTLKQGYAAADLGWNFEAIGKAIESLSEAGLIQFDQSSETVRIVNWVSFNPPTNAKHALGILSHLKTAQSKELKLQSLQEFSDCIEVKGFNNDKGLVNAVNTLFKAYGEGIATKTETKTETESRPDQDRERDRDAQSEDCLAADSAAALPDGAVRPPLGRKPTASHLETGFLKTAGVGK
jgi:hypothetical protein